MKKFLKILGAAALVAGFAPFRFAEDEETGTQKLEALLWSVSRTPAKDGSGKSELSFGLGLLSSLKKEEEEAHLFSDELTVDYGVSEDSGAAEPEDEAPAEEEAPEEPEAAGETGAAEPEGEAPAEETAPEEPEAAGETGTAVEAEELEEPETPISEEDA